MFFQLFFKTIILDFFRFPVWWYTTGTIGVLRSAGHAMQAREATIGVRIWFKNIFVPMYGQYEWKGRVISFCFRILLLVVRLLWLFAWVAIIVGLVALYLMWPIGAIAGFVILWS